METKQIAIRGRQPASLFYSFEADIEPQNGGAIGESSLPWHRKLSQVSSEYRLANPGLYAAMENQKNAIIFDSLAAALNDQIVDWG